MRPGARRTMRWGARTREALRLFPQEVRWVFGRALYKAENDDRHEIASSMRGDLRGIVELTTNEHGNTYRVYYSLKCPGYVYVLYCHKKKSKRGSEIPRHEKDLILDRYRTAMADCKETLRV